MENGRHTCEGEEVPRRPSVLHDLRGVSDLPDHVLPLHPQGLWWHASDIGVTALSDWVARCRVGVDLRTTGLPDLRRGVYRAVHELVWLQSRRDDGVGR